jgi:hypothetical protein
VQQILNFQNAKTSKGEKKNYKTGIIYFAPNTIASKTNLCPYATPGCIAACLYTAGRGGFTSIQKARIAKTQAFLANPAAFKEQLEKEIKRAYRSAEKKGYSLTIRLNGTSDLAVETWGIMQKFPNVQFYDYTKNPKRMQAFLNGEMPVNYHLTFSLSETNKDQALAFLKQGGNVAVVFHKKKDAAFPSSHWGFPVVSGDDDDLRFLDPKGVIVGLRDKGKATKDALGFVQMPEAA